MARTVYFNNCIKEISNTVFGRNCRKPIADALEHISNQYYGVVPVLKRVTANVNADVVDWIETIPHLQYVNYREESRNTNNLTLTSLGNSDYRLTDSKANDHVTNISGDNYIFDLGTGWYSPEGLSEDSYYTYEYVEHHDTYYLTIIRQHL